MQITLNNDEIVEAVENYVRSQINISDDQDISIDFTAGRGANGLTATLDIVPAKAKRPSKKSVMRAAAEEAPAKPENPDLPAEDKVEEEAPAEEVTEKAAAPRKLDLKAAVSEDTETSSGDDGEEAPAEEAKPATSPRSIFSKAG